MSYIRCTSNPESLYIWADVKHKLTITQGSALWGKKGWPRTIYGIPESQFNGILRKWSKGFQMGCKHKDLELEEVFLSTQGRPWLNPIPWSLYIKDFLFCLWTYCFPSKELRDIKPLKGAKKKSFLEVWKFVKPPEGDYQWVLRYRGKVVMECWATTLFYLSDHVRWEDLRS